MRMPGFRVRHNPVGRAHGDAKGDAQVVLRKGVNVEYQDGETVGRAELDFLVAPPGHACGLTGDSATLAAGHQGEAVYLLQTVVPDLAGSVLDGERQG